MKMTLSLIYFSVCKHSTLWITYKKVSILVNRTKQSPFCNTFIILFWLNITSIFANQKYFSSTMFAAAAAAKSLRSCPTLCDPIDASPPGSPVPGILQARTPEWVAISFSNAWKWKVKVKSLSRVRLLVTPWTAAHQAPPSMGFSRQEYWSGVPLPSPLSFLRVWQY